jgi:hypothetical protein
MQVAPRSFWKAAALLLASATLASCGGSDDRSAAPTVQVLSSKPELVTGGTALVAVRPEDSNGPLKATLNGVDVTAAFQPDTSTPGRVIGVLSGLTVGTNTFVADYGGDARTVTLTNYPITGPVISGPHQTPYICQTEAFTLPDGSKLGPALDANCSVTTRVHYLYLKTNATTLTPVAAPAAVPADAATTTTLAGTTVPFIVRVETGTVDRGIYQSAVLHNPVTETAPTPVVPPKGWNRRLIAIQGFGCPAGWYIQGASQGNLPLAGFDFSLLNIKRLGEGYAMFANTLHHASNNCNAVLASEAAMMSKEHFVKTHGVPAFTVSAGCSGGSYGSAQPADRIPDLFDGVLIACTFPDPLSIALTGSDGNLLARYWEVTDPIGFTEAQKVAVTGHKNYQAFIDAANQSGRTDPISGRVIRTGYNAGTFNAAVPIPLRYNPVTNPTGVRGTVYDAAKNIYGVNPTTGFALRPFDNVGVQYGLKALNAGTITPTQFLDLNERIGGYDQDANFVAGRSVGDPGAMDRAQKSGLQIGGNGGLASIPVFDVTGIYNEDAAYHYQWFHFSLRERMAKANGNADNHVMWRGNPVPAETAWSTFIDWVVAYKADTSSATQRAKVIARKPATAVDGCWSSPTQFVAEPQTLSRTANTACNTLFPSWTFPREVAGGPVAANIMKCSLKAPSAADYSVAFSAAEQTRLATVFAAGVCDWTKAGNQVGVVTDGSFGPSPLNLVSGL